MTKLEKTITPTLRKYAGDEQHLDVIRENCRKTVSEFIEDWLLREGQWGEGRLRVVKVYFPGKGNWPGRSSRTTRNGVRAIEHVTGCSRRA